MFAVDQGGRSHLRFGRGLLGQTGRVVVNDQPLALLPAKCKAKASRRGNRLAIAYPIEGVCSAIECKVAVDANVLLAEYDPCIRPRRSIFEILCDGGGCGGDCLQICSPENGIWRVHRSNALRIAAVVGSTPLVSGSANLLHGKFGRRWSCCGASRQTDK